MTRRAVSLVVPALVIALTWGCESYELSRFRLSVPGTPMSLTFGPGGGFVYPRYVILAATAMSRIPCTPADRFVLHLLPRPLVAWSLLPGPAMAWSSLTCAGPVQALLAGAALTALLSVLALLSRRLRSWRSAQSRAPL